MADRCGVEVTDAHGESGTGSFLAGFADVTEVDRALSETIA